MHSRMNSRSTDGTTDYRTHEHSLNWKLLLLIASSYIALGVNMQGFSALLPLMQEEFGLTRAQAGLYPTFFFTTATTIAIFSGRLVDILGSKKGMVFGVASVALFMILHSISPSFLIILLLGSVTGLAFSMITPSINRGVMETTPPAARGTAMGLTHSGMGVGGFVGASILPAAAVVLGWRYSILGSALFAGLVAVLIFFFYSDGGRNAPGEEKEESGAGGSSLRKDFAALFRDRYFMSVCFMGLIIGATIGSSTTHLAIYLHRDLGLSTALAGMGLGIFQLGGITGMPGWGMVSDRVLNGDRRLSLLILGLVIASLIIVTGAFFTSPGVPLAVVFVLIYIMGVAVLGSPAIYFTTITELGGQERTGVSTGLALIFSRAGIVITPPLFGYIADLAAGYRYSWLLLGTLVLLLTLAFGAMSRRFRPEADTRI